MRLRERDRPVRAITGGWLGTMALSVLVGQALISLDQGLAGDVWAAGIALNVALALGVGAALAELEACRAILVLATAGGVGAVLCIDFLVVMARTVGATPWPFVVGLTYFGIPTAFAGMAVLLAAGAIAARAARAASQVSPPCRRCRGRVRSLVLHG